MALLDLIKIEAPEGCDLNVDVALLLITREMKTHEHPMELIRYFRVQEDLACGPVIKDRQTFDVLQDPRPTTQSCLNRKCCASSEPRHHC